MTSSQLQHGLRFQDLFDARRIVDAGKLHQDLGFAVEPPRFCTLDSDSPRPLIFFSMVLMLWVSVSSFSFSA